MMIISFFRRVIILSQIVIHKKIYIVLRLEVKIFIDNDLSWPLPWRWLPGVFTNNISYLAYVTERNLVTLSLQFCSRDSPLRLPI